MNRRRMLLGSVGTLVFPFLGCSEKRPDWFSHQDLMYIYEKVRNHCAREYLDLRNPEYWKDEELSWDDRLYLSLLRVSNKTFRRSLDSQSSWWVVVPTTVYKKFPEYFFLDCSKNEVAPGITKIGTMHNKWITYLDENFPEDLILIGRGFKKVIRFKFNNGEIQSYLGSTTAAHYGIIRIIY